MLGREGGDAMTDVSSANELRFQQYAETVWPIHRYFTREKLANRCSNCALSEVASPLKNGECNYCREFTLTSIKRPDVHQEAEMLHRLRVVANTEANHHALVLLSGGKDSTWLLWYLRNTIPELKILCLQVDNGFLSRPAIENARRVTTLLDVDYVIYRPQQSSLIREFNAAFKQAVSTGCYGSVDNFDGSMSHDIGRTMAAQQSIPIVMSGVSWEQIQRIFKISHYQIPVSQEQQETLYWHPHLYNHIADFFLPFAVWAKSEQGICHDLIKHNLMSRRQTSPLLTNSGLVPLMGVTDICNLGYNSFELEFCNMVRQGKADYVFWSRVFSLLEYCGKTGFLLKPIVQKTMKKLRLTSRDLNIPWAKL